MLITYVAQLRHEVSHCGGMTDAKYQEVVSRTETGVPCGKTTAHHLYIYLYLGERRALW
jgi:hypothetical protein